MKQTYKLAYYFFFTVLLFQCIFWNFNLNRLLAPLFLSSASIPEFPVFGGSYWFVPQYVISLIVSYIFLTYISKIINFIFIVFVCTLIAFSYFNYFKFDFVVFGLSPASTLAYSSMMLGGYYLYNINNRKLWATTAFILGAILILCWIKTPGFWLQNYKSPVQFPYLVASFLSLSLVLLLKCNFNLPFLSFIGRNSIFFLYITRNFFFIDILCCE